MLPLRLWLIEFYPGCLSSPLLTSVLLTEKMGSSTALGSMGYPTGKLLVNVTSRAKRRWGSKPTIEDQS